MSKQRICIHAQTLVHQANLLWPPHRMSVVWKSADLPNMPKQMPRVTLFLEQFKYFGDMYKIMGEFIGVILGKADWSLYDLERYYALHEDERKRCPKCGDFIGKKEGAA